MGESCMYERTHMYQHVQHMYTCASVHICKHAHVYICTCYMYTHAQTCHHTHARTHHSLCVHITGIQNANPDAFGACVHMGSENRDGGGKRARGLSRDAAVTGAG